MSLEEARKYLFRIRFYILFSFLLVFSGIFGGYFFAKNFPDETRIFLEEIRDVFSSGKESSSFEIFLFILDNNITNLLIMLVLGIFAGVIPMFSAFANGFIIGIFAFVSSREISWEFFLAGVLPHGIIEIPVLVISVAVGLRVGKVAVFRIFSKKESLTEEFAKGLKLYIMILAPMLFVAALIESFITPVFLSWV